MGFHIRLFLTKYSLWQVLLWYIVPLSEFFFSESAMLGPQQGSADQGVNQRVPVQGWPWFNLHRIVEQVIGRCKFFSA